MPSIEYIGEKHYSKALQRIEKLEQQQAELIVELNFLIEAFMGREEWDGTEQKERAKALIEKIEAAKDVQ